MSVLAHSVLGLKVLPALTQPDIKVLVNTTSNERADIPAGSKVIFNASGWARVQMPDGQKVPVRELLPTPVCETSEAEPKRYLGKETGAIFIAELLRIMSVVFAAWPSAAGLKTRNVFKREIGVEGQHYWFDGRQWQDRWAFCKRS